MNIIYYVLLICAIGAAACSPPSAEPPTASGIVANPTIVLTEPPSVTATPVPLPTATLGPDPQSTPVATYTPRPRPTIEPTISPDLQEKYNRIDFFFDDFKGLSYEADLDYPSDMSDCDCPVKAHVSGWTWLDDSSQMFARIEMVEPIERSLEAVTRSSFDVYLKDLDDDVWYFIPENTDMSGPLEDIMSVQFLGMMVWVVPDIEELEQVQDGYVWEPEDFLVGFGSITVKYDLERTSVRVTWTDDNGHEILRARYFDINVPHEFVPHRKGELIPDTYWHSQ